MKKHIQLFCLREKNLLWHMCRILKLIHKG